MEASEEEKLTK